MGCNCKVTEIVLGIVVLIFALWPDWIGAMASKWIVGIAAVLLILHAATCKNCAMPKSRRR